MCCWFLALIRNHFVPLITIIIWIGIYITSTYLFYFYGLCYVVLVTPFYPYTKLCWTYCRNKSTWINNSWLSAEQLILNTIFSHTQFSVKFPNFSLMFMNQFILKHFWLSFKGKNLEKKINFDSSIYLHAVLFHRFWFFSICMRRYSTYLTQNQ